MKKPEHGKSLTEQVAHETVVRLREHGYEAYWVGGCVRNMLLGLPAEDIDIATNARPEATMQLFPRTIPVGVRFGVILVVQNDVQLEVATFRSDGMYLDYRHPQEVHFSTAREDALRRDFTMNALFYDPLEKRIIDFVGGEEDLKAGIIRGIGNPGERFREDALRMLRAIRFATRFGFTIEPTTWAALCESASLITQISADRIREELIKIFCGPKAGRALELMDQSGLLKEILPEVAQLKGIPQPPSFHPEGDVFTHTVVGMNLLDNPTPTLAFGFLLHDVGKFPTYEEADRARFNYHDKVGAEIADGICRRLNFSSADRNKIVELVERHMKFLHIREMRQAKLKRFLASPTIAEDLELHRIDCLASHADLENYNFCKEKLEEFAREEEELIPPPLITGDDLIDAGYKPGPLFKEILNTVAEHQLEGTFKSKRQALNFVKRKYQRKE
jgi:tRNA nucleotidyltransferase/poly(A) polymerase